MGLDREFAGAVPSSCLESAVLVSIEQGSYAPGAEWLNAVAHVMDHAGQSRSWTGSTADS